MKTRNLSRGLRLAILALLILDSIPNLQYVKGTNQPLAAFTYYPCVACAAPGDVVFFNANASTSMTGPIVSYAWNFGDGSPTVKTSSSYQTHDFLTALPGKWQVTLTVRDINGSTDTISQLVLFNVAPDFTIQPARPETGAPAPVTFNGSTTRVYQNATTPQPKFLWTFGDGFNGTGVIILHKYQAPGPYRVALTVVTSQGSPTISEILIVRPTPQGSQQIQVSFENINITIFANIATNTTSHIITGTVSVIATNTTTGTTIFTRTFNLTINMGPDNSPRRFLVAITSSSPVIAMSCTIDPATVRLGCFASRDPDVRGDGRVDIVDISMGMYDYGAAMGSLRYSPAVDLDGQWNH